MIYKNLRNLYLNPVARQISRDIYNQAAVIIDSILSRPKNKLITALTLLITYAGIARVSLAKNISYKRQITFGHIKNPYQPQEYMRDLANRLNPKDGELLLRGMDISRPAPVKEYRVPIAKPEAKPDEKPQPQKKEVKAHVVYKDEVFVKELENALARVPREELQIPSKQKPEYAPWSISNDLDQYRNHAVEQGSRDSAENLEKALSHLGLSVEDLANIITLAYGSDRAKEFRANDGKPLSFHLGKVGEAGGWTIVNITDGGYSIADLILLDSLPNIEKEAYQNNHPLVRPFVFTGSAMGSAWKTVENVGNVPTWGLFDNLTGPTGTGVENIVESLKHFCEAGTNLTRGPFYLVFGKSENLDKILDWPTLVIFEYSSNVIEMKGISNMQNYEDAFNDKGVIGSIAELGGSGYLVIRTVDEIVEELEHESSKKRAVIEEQEPELPEPPFEPPETLLPKPPFPRPPYNGGGWYIIIVYS